MRLSHHPGRIADAAQQALTPFVFAPSIQRKMVLEANVSAARSNETMNDLPSAQKSSNIL
jgi:hypothetical protein